MAAFTMNQVPLFSFYFSLSLFSFLFNLLKKGQYQSTGVTWYGGGVIGVAHVPETNQLYWYKDGSRVFTHNVAKVLSSFLSIKTLR